MNRVMLFVLCLNLGISSVRAQPGYFLMRAIYDRTYSRGTFVLPVRDAKHLVHARELVAAFNSGSNVVGRIPFFTVEWGPDHINRDQSLPGAPEWLWHVKDVVGFGDYLPSIAQPGTPLQFQTYINLPFYEYYYSLSNKGVWLEGFTPIAELDIATVARISIVQRADGLELHWPDFDSYYMYTIEYADELTANAQWKVVEGISWPSFDTSLVVPLSAAHSKFYRLKLTQHF